MREVVLAALARRGAGVVIALAIIGLGAVLGGVAGGGVVLVGGALAAGALWQEATVHATRRRLPPPGRLVDIGGHRVHVLAEGECRAGRPAVVWFAGAHGAGMAIHHLHRHFRAHTRSILVDRPGSGWSDTGPFPRTTAREADEVMRALDAAGERGPFVVAGHSFGGLLAANIARRHPGRIHTLVLLDPTPLETIVFGPRLGALKAMRRGAWLSGLAALFHLPYDAAERQRREAPPVHQALLHRIDEVLGAQAVAARAVERQAGHWFAQASIYRELTPEGAAAVGWDTVVYDGDLGDLPVLLVGPRNDIDVSLLPEARDAAGREGRRMANFFARSRERYLAVSTRAQRVVAPEGTGHNFVYERPDFVIEVVQGVVDRA